MSDSVKIEYFDCNAQIGRYGVRHPEAFTEANKLVKEMEYTGISEALVYHALAKEYAPSVGNSMLSEEVEGKPLHQCWVVMPHHTEEMPPPDKLLDAMKRNRAVAARAFPILHQYRLSDWCSGELLDMIEGNGIPLFLDLDQTNWDEIAVLLRDFPKLNLVILRTSYRIDRYVYPLFEKFENLYIEAATYQVNHGIEEICKRFGAERLLFGSGLPVTEAGPSIAQISYAEISDNEKRLIAGGNIKKLLSWLS